MNREALRRVGRQLRKNNQKGFTLIELLVVVSVLGILAAIVTMSLVGITNAAQDRAAKTELQTVQTAYDTMLADQQVPAHSECSGAASGTGDATNDMSHFPNNAPGTSPAQHTVALYPGYLRQQTTHGRYYCTNSGQISQASYTP